MAQLIDTSKNIILEEGEREFWDKEFPGISKTNLLFRWGKYYPFHLFTKTHNPEFVLGKNLFITTWNKRLYKLPPDLDKIKKKLIENERKRRKRIGGLWWSDKQCRLRAIEAGTPLDKDKVQLHLEMVDYADHFVSNLHLNKPVLPGRKTIREKFIKNPDDIFALEDSKLANPLPTNTFVVNRRQMKGIIGLRSKDVAFRRGYYCIAGGYIRVEGQDNDLGKDGKPDPFKGALREAEFETGLSINKITCLGVGVDLIYGYPDILFLAETLDPVEKVFSSPKQDGYEMDACIVDLTNENDVRRYLDPKYIGTHDAACIILSIEKLLPDIYLGEKNRKKITDKDKKVPYVRVWTVKTPGSEISKFEADQLIKKVKDTGGLVIEKTGDFFKISFGYKDRPNPYKKYVFPIIEHTLKNGGVAGDIYEILSVTCDDNSILGKLKELREIQKQEKKLRYASDDEAWMKVQATSLGLDDKLISMTNNLRSEISRGVNAYLKPLKVKIKAPVKGSRSIRERAVYKLDPLISFVFVEY